jgi:hypothetical protein
MLCSFNTRLKTKKWYQTFDQHCSLIVPNLCPKYEFKSDGTPRKVPSSVKNSPNCLLYRHAIEVILRKLVYRCLQKNLHNFWCKYFLHICLFQVFHIVTDSPAMSTTEHHYFIFYLLMIRKNIRRTSFFYRHHKILYNINFNMFSPRTHIISKELTWRFICEYCMHKVVIFMLFTTLYTSFFLIRFWHMSGFW